MANHLVMRNKIRWILIHPIWITDQHGKQFAGRRGDGIDYDFVYVNPHTNKIDKDDSLNTKFQVWLEAGPLWTECDNTQHSHDPRLNCSGDTIEAVLLKLADLVEKYYGVNKMLGAVAP